MSESSKFAQNFNFIDVYVVKERVRKSHSVKEVRHNFRDAAEAENFLVTKQIEAFEKQLRVGSRCYSNIKVAKAITSDEGKTIHILGYSEPLI